MAKKADKQVGIFKYDLFPFMVVHEILGWTDEGGIRVIATGYIMPPSALIAVFPIKKKSELEAAFIAIKEEYRKVQKETRERLLVELVKQFPALKRT